jgi:hypothetical protein
MIPYMIKNKLHVYILIINPGHMIKGTTTNKVIKNKVHKHMLAHNKTTVSRMNKALFGYMGYNPTMDLIRVWIG